MMKCNMARVIFFYVALIVSVTRSAAQTNDVVIDWDNTITVSKTTPTLRKAGVAELKALTKLETYWDFTYSDSTMRALMQATEGHSVVINFSTTPASMWKTSSIVKYPDDP